MVACGSAYHVCVTAQYVLEDLAGLPVRTELASEFRYRRLLLQKDELVIIVSQSGETADSLAALREAKRQGTARWPSSTSWALPLRARRDSVLYNARRAGDRRGHDEGVLHASSSSATCSPSSLRASAGRSTRRARRSSSNPWPRCPRRWSACSRTRSASSGSRRSLPRRRTPSSSDAAWTTPSAWRAA